MSNKWTFENGRKRGLVGKVRRTVEAQITTITDAVTAAGIALSMGYWAAGAYAVSMGNAYAKQREALHNLCDPEAESINLDAPLPESTERGFALHVLAIVQSDPDATVGVVAKAIKAIDLAQFVPVVEVVEEAAPVLEEAAPVLDEAA